MKRLFALFVVFFLLSLSANANTTNQPSIQSVQINGTNIIVVGSVPAGLKKVTLQSRQRFDGSAWEPRAVNRLDGAGGRIVFHIALSAKVELLRIQADPDDVLPASFYQGTNSFLGEPGSAPAAVADVAPTDKNGAVTSPSNSPVSRDVVESDIWKVRGDTLYFFNQYRGLQVIDVANPAAPQIRGTLSLPASGEQMYLIETNYAVLLARTGCGYGTSDESQVLIVDVTGGAPVVRASLSVPGWIQESRMVGSALYVVSQTYKVSATNANTWEWGSMVTSFDLAVPAKPAARNSFWYPGYGNTIYATDQYLFISSIVYDGTWNQSQIRCIDISSPDGVMQARGSITTSGQIDDKFKMNLDGDIFTTISARWDPTRRWVTSLENFSLADAANPKKLGRLELAVGEQLHATRFDGKRVYVVTFFRIDPLWIVDLTDPAKPSISGELQVPGWSTYIYPMGDRLLAMGIDNTNSWRAAVSLFDVHDTAKPSLIGKVAMGENYSWSEASYDDKAFGVVPEAGLLLVPYSGDSTNGYVSRVQLIDFTKDRIALRGVIEHQFQPRRATLQRNYVLSISGKELISVDASDRDHPVAKSDIQLSWTVNRVFARGKYIVEIDNGNSWTWNGKPAPLINVAATSNPNTLVKTLALSNSLPILGATFQDGLLHIVQSDRGYYGPIAFLTATGEEVVKTNGMNCHFSILDLRNLPAITVLGETDAVVDPLGWSDLQASWPKPELLVWSGGGGYNWFFPGGPIALDTVKAAGIVGGRGIWWNGGSGGHLLAVDVSTPATPKFVSEVNVTTNGWWNFSRSFAANGLVYASHQTSEFVEGLRVPGQTQAEPTVTTNKETGQSVTNFPVVGTWIQRYYLDVIDYANPAAPTVRKPVNIPGLLNGVSKQGALIYTAGSHWSTNATTDWSTWLDASAYDGVSSFLVDSLSIPSTWPAPYVVSDDNVFLGRPGDTNAPNSLEIWTLGENGHFALKTALKVDVAAQSLSVVNDLLTGQFNGAIRTYTRSLLPVASGEIGGCFGFDLSQSDGSVSGGLWVPLYDYGVFNVK